MKSLFRILFFLFAFAYGQGLFAAGMQRAFIIGIDTYNQTGSSGRWTNLEGCANDAISVMQVLESRYGFSNENLSLLLNEKASRENILSGFNRLLEACEPGDIAVIYYAGHGSQVKNSMSEEKDKKDESMVPADACFGASDIRDKELAVIFNKFADKGVLLTVFYDSCHSGSIGRGAISSVPPKVRYIAEDPLVDANDPSLISPPEKRGVLIMSASQDFEYASEQRDADGTPHGAFTIALLQSLTTLPVNSSAADIFSSLRAILKYNGQRQEPVLAATEERKQQTIFGIEKGNLSGKTMAAVLDITPYEITLQGGFTIGIYPESILSCEKQEGTVTVKVKTVDAINKCTAIVTEGDISILNGGDLFELKNWRLPESSLLKVYITPSPYSYQQIVDLAKGFAGIGLKKNITIVQDPVSELISHTVFFSDGSWFMGLPSNKVINLGKKPDNKTIIKNLPEGSSVYISLPAPNELVKTLKTEFQERNAVEAVTESSEAQYFLTGRIAGEKLEYAFFIPQVSVIDHTFDNAMPLRTDFFSIENRAESINAAVVSLSDYSLRIAKIKAWLTLSPPPDDGSFPFRLSIKNANTDQFVSNDCEVKVGDVLGFFLELDEASLKYWDKSRRYIYVFSIDSKGKMDLWFPLGGSVENRAPWFDTKGGIIKQAALGRSKLLRVTEPVGTDTYIMLTTNEPIPNPEVLNQEGVITRGANSGYAQLLNIGAGTRGSLITPSEWGIHRIVVKSSK